MLSLASVSGFTSISINLEKPKTELVSSQRRNVSDVTKYKNIPSNHLTITHSNFTHFNFKLLLNTHKINTLNTLKSQKRATIQFLKPQFLEQNLIAKINTGNYKVYFIKQ